MHFTKDYLQEMRSRAMRTGWVAMEYVAVAIRAVADGGMLETSTGRRVSPSEVLVIPELTTTKWFGLKRYRPDTEEWRMHEMRVHLEALHGVLGKPMTVTVYPPPGWPILAQTIEKARGGPAPTTTKGYA